jgi:hypothetical protein
VACGANPACLLWEKAINPPSAVNIKATPSGTWMIIVGVAKQPIIKKECFMLKLKINVPEVRKFFNYPAEKKGKFFQMADYKAQDSAGNYRTAWVQAQSIFYLARRGCERG